MSSRAKRALATVVVVALSVLVIPSTAFAHEHREAAGHEWVVGWANEPAFAGFLNAVSLRLSEHETGEPVTDAELEVEVIFGDEKLGPIPLDPAFGPTFGTPGEYETALVPTRPGTYTFRFTGTLDGEAVDEKFTSGEETFDSIEAPTEIQFPAQDPSAADLATRLDRVASRSDEAVDAANDADDSASGASTLGIIGIVLGALGALGGGAALIRSRTRST